MQVVKFSMNGEQGPWKAMEPFGGDYAIPFEHREKRASDFSFRIFTVMPPKVGDKLHQRDVVYHVENILVNTNPDGEHRTYLVLVEKFLIGKLLSSNFKIMSEGDVLNLVARSN